MRFNLHFLGQYYVEVTKQHQYKLNSA